MARSRISRNPVVARPDGWGPALRRCQPSCPSAGLEGQTWPGRSPARWPPALGRGRTSAPVSDRRCQSGRPQKPCRQGTVSGPSVRYKWLRCSPRGGRKPAVPRRFGAVAQPALSLVEKDALLCDGDASPAHRDAVDAATSTERWVFDGTPFMWRTSSTTEQTRSTCSITRARLVCSARSAARWRSHRPLVCRERRLSEHDRKRDIPATHRCGVVQAGPRHSLGV